MSVSARRCGGCGRTKGCDAYQFGRYWHLPCLRKERERRALRQCPTVKCTRLAGHEGDCQIFALTERGLTKDIKDLNKHCDGPANIALCVRESHFWGLCMADDEGAIGNEEVPGDDRPLDATGAARRLLAAFKDAHEKR